MASTHLLVFGDQVIDKRPMIRNLVRNSKSSPSARRFLQEATDVVQIELGKLTPDEHGWTGDNFESLLGLAEAHAARESSDTALFFITSLMALIGRIGDLIVRAERDPTILGSKEAPVHVLALCAGQVPAAAAVAARDTSELFTIAKEIISNTCRWMRVAHRHRLAMLSPSQVGGWCITYPGLDAARAQSIVDDFHATYTTPVPNRIAIGVVSKGWLTLVGPAATLRQLHEYSSELRNAPQVASDAGVPAHAPFMAGVDADDIVGHSELLDRPLDWSTVTMVTPSGDCGPRRFGTLRELLCDIFEDILLRKLVVDRTIESAISRLDRKMRVSVHEVGLTSHMPLIFKTLAAVGQPYDAVPAYTPPPPGSDALSRGNSDLVAIVGMSGRFPGSDNVDEFWNELMSGACHIKKVPESRYDVDRYFDANQKLKNSTAIKDGAWLNDPGAFDNRFFNVSPREAMQMDPVQRLCLTTTHEALEMAGYAPGASPAMDPERVGTFIGVTGYDWLETLHQQGNDIYYVTGAAKAFVSGKINYHYKFGRGAYTLDSVCASSTTALTLACKSLLSRDTDMAVAGGGSVFSAPFDFSGVGRSGMISFDGGCRTFHDDADGYARGEGVGMVVLKRLEDALADKDHILGVISGSARMYSTESTSITHPAHTSQEKIYREVLGQTALDPEEIVYVEMHGTGTQAGDFEELSSVLNVMGGQRIANNPLTVGAVKAAMGHGEGVAGVTALIKTLMMLKHRTIPSQPGVPFTMNHRFPKLDKRNVHIALAHKALEPSPKSHDGRIKMLVNTFDASGGNCSLLVEEAPYMAYESPSRPQDIRSAHVVALSARSTPSLIQNGANLLAYMEQHPDIRLADLAYTSTARRMHSTLRKAFVCNSVEDLARQLRAQPLDKVKKNEAHRSVFLFTGQGSQYEAMGMGLYQTSPRFRDLMQTYQLTAACHDLPEFLSIIAGTVDPATASPCQVQLAIVALELGVAHMLRTWGIVPSAVIGHSLGEYAALCVAGVLSPSDALYLVGRRALLMEQHLTPNTHAMLATQLTAEDLQARMQKEHKAGRLQTCAVACFNAPSATVASGTVTDVTALQELLASENMRSTRLDVPFGFHSTHVDPVLESFEKIAGGVAFKKPVIPVASTLLGEVVDTEGVFGPSYLARQARQPVDFVAALRAIETAGFASTPKSKTLWIETGPDAVCTGMVRKTLGIEAAQLLPTLKAQKDNWDTVSAVLKMAYEHALPVDWKAVHGEFADGLMLLSDLPAYTWDYKNFWTPYTVPPAWEIEEALTAYKNGTIAPIQQTPAIDNGFVPSMCLQKLVDETADKAARSVKSVFSASTAAPGLKKAIEGHVVNGHALMPLAVFCDMAMTSARHCYTRVEEGTVDSTQMTIQDMVITKAIVLNEAAPPSVIITAAYAGAAASADVTFHQADAQGKPAALLGKCRVAIASGSKALTSDQNQTVFLVKARMKQLRSLAAAGGAHSLLRPVVYKLFGDYVRCGPEYRSMDEVVVSNASEDALATITAPAANEYAANSALSPFLYDGVNQLTGFLLNNSIRCEDDAVIHISEGFGESRTWQPLVPGRKYLTYAAGQDLDAAGQGVEATSYVFDAEDGNLVQMVTGVKFTKMKKAVLDHVLGGPKPAAKVVAKPAAAPVPAPVAVPAASKPHIVVSPSKNETVEVVAEPEPARDSSVIDHLLAVVAAEVGVGLEDMTDETIFGDLGVDSLMAITVLSTIRHELGLDLPPAFFMDYDSVGAAKQALLVQMQLQDIEPHSSSVSSVDGDDAARFSRQSTVDHSEISSVAGDVVAKVVEVGEVEMEEPSSLWNDDKAAITTTIVEADPPDQETILSATMVEKSEKTYQDCKIVLLQDSPQDAAQAAPTVFLLADETGSSAGYVLLPSLGGPCVYGVDWPADFDPSEPNLLASLADAVASSIQAHSAPGPYILGGVTFGAVLAVEVARRLPAHELAGVLVLDPPTGVEDVLRTKDRLLKGRVPRPAQVKKVDGAARAMDTYSYASATGLSGPVVLVVPEANAGKDWTAWLPGSETRAVDGAQAGGLLKFPSINAAGLVCHDAVTAMKA